MLQSFNAFNSTNILKTKRFTVAQIIQFVTFSNKFPSLLAESGIIEPYFDCFAQIKRYIFTKSGN